MKGMLSCGLILFLVLSLRAQTTISINTDSSIYYGKRNTHKIINLSFTNTSGIPIEIIGIKHLNSDSSVFGLFDLGMELKRQRTEVDSAKSIYCSYDLGVISRFNRM